MSAMVIKSQPDFEVEDAMRTLIRASEIKKDGAMMKKVRALAKQKLSEMRSVANGGDDENGDSE